MPCLLNKGCVTGTPFSTAAIMSFGNSLVSKNTAERSFKSRAYDAYPRGRVVYFPKRKEFCLYHDACLRLEREIRAVVEWFELAGAKIELMEDGHYKCMKR